MSLTPTSKRMTRPHGGKKAPSGTLEKAREASQKIRPVVSSLKFRPILRLSVWEATRSLMAQTSN